MTPDQMAELAARLSEKSARFRKHADFLLTIVPGDPINTVAANGLTADADDFDRAADLIEQMAQAAPVAAPLVLAFNEGYMSGHHDTVEACFVNIHPSDMDTYHADVVADLGLSLAPPAREPLTDERLREIHHLDQFGLFCDYAEFEQIARAIEEEHGIKGGRND